MEKWLKWMMAACGIALLLLAAVWGTSKLLGASRAERQALATMSQPLQAKGRNAYPAIWLLDYPVPPEQREALMAEDVRRLAGSPLPEGDAAAARFTSVAAQRYPSDLPPYAVRQRLCSAREDCLAKVRADLPGYDKLLADHAAWIARAAQAIDADYLHNRFPPRMDMPLPSFVPTYGPATLQAARFAHGERMPAIAATCQAIIDWRKLGAGSDMLLASGIARGYGAEGYGRLLAQMLAEVPLDSPLPAPCAQAMALPDAAEISMCGVMRGEFNFISRATAAMAQAEARRRGVHQALFFDEDTTRAMTALPMAKYCDPATDAAFAADKAPPAASIPSIYRLPCVANAIGCILSSISSPAYQGFELGHRDGLAMKRTLAALAWWRIQPDAAQDPQAVLKRLPDEYRAAAHPLRLDKSGRYLVMPTLNAGRGDIAWPLPGSRVAAPAG